jgi:uncharacterized protein (DUF1330 family)
MSSSIDPSREQFSRMMKIAHDGPVHMLNLIRLREKAAYEDGRDATGAEAYKSYGKESAPIFSRVGGKIVHAWDPKLVLIGPEDEAWDIAFIAEYPSAAAFGEMVKDPAYQAIVFHRQAAVADSRLIRLHPREAGSGFGI